MATLKLDDDVLRVLAEGLDRLNDGSLSDIARVKRVESEMARSGFVRENLSWGLASEAARGYVNGVYTFQDFHGNWCPIPAPGSTLTFDQAGEIPLRKT